MSDAIAAFPVPGADRWRPTRAGLVSLWRYWDETFTFHRGRLLLRGPNGSGKSMALELLLPFLLDADASPAKLTSAAKSRGGLYERIMTGTDEPTRAGFAWVEFRRGTEVFTAGVRVRASTATRRADHDFFTTSQEIGTELHLLDAQRIPLSRKLLSEAIGERGRVHSSGGEHRAAVRQALFPDFSADQFSSVITALLALRKEKLSQNLDLAKLSDVLSEALPPIDDHDLAVVAEGFERLDRRRTELTKLESELAEIKVLAARQRDYARAVVASVAHQVTSAEYRRDAVTRAEREARTELAGAQQQGVAVEAELVSVGDRIDAIDVEVTALKDSDAYREGASLNDLRDQARRLRELVARFAGTAEQTAADVDEAAAALSDAQARLDDATANRALATTALRDAAAPVGAEGIAAVAVDGDGEPDESERLLAAWVHARHNLIGELRHAISAYRDAVRQRSFVERQAADDESAVERLDGNHRESVCSHRTAVEAYADAVESWASSCMAVGPERIEPVLPDPVAEPAAVVAAVGELAADLGADLAVARRDIETRTAAARDERAVLDDQRVKLAEGRLVEPVVPEWRGSRAGRGGAPLWQLVDVRDGIDAGVVDRLESALVAGGLIDAWVHPDGRLELATAAADAVLTHRPARGRTLQDVLAPLEGAAVDATVVAGVLASVPVAESVPVVDTADLADGAGPEVVVGLDGTFRMGPLVGRGPARSAELLGAAARERRRQQRIAELEAAIAEVDARLCEIGRDAARVERRAEAIDADFALLPPGAPVDDAARRVTEAAARLGQAEDRLATSRQQLSEAEDGVRTALRALTTLGARHGLPTDEDELTRVDEALSRLDRAIVAWARRARDVVAGERDRNRATAQLEGAKRAADGAARNHESCQREAIAVEGRLATLESSIGVEYQAVLDRIGDLGTERRSAKSRHRELSDQRPVIERRIGGLETQVSEAEVTRQRADDERGQSHTRLLRVVAEGVAADAGVASPGPLDGVTAMVAGARALAAALESVPAELQDVERAGARVTECMHLAQSVLGGRIDLARELSDEGWWVVRAMTGGLRRSAADLQAALAGELDHGRAELAADEERLFEQTLAGSVRRALADRIRQATALVDGINAQLGAVKTAAAGVQVRLRWEVDPDQPDAVKAARGLLLRDPANLSDEERGALQAFVRARVDQARAELEANAPWEARLRQTLDYRSWHHFGLQLGHRDWEGFQPATARRLQRLSTGERSIALHLPMLASIAAHYAKADGTPSGCPRLILLDELFAGVDTANRSQLFGTFTSWDLDAVFTSDHEWCQYAALDGIAIHHLHPPTGDEPVTSTRFTWDGRHRSIDPAA